MTADERDIDRWRNQQYQHWNDELAARRKPAGDLILPQLHGARTRIRPLESGDKIQLHPGRLMNMKRVSGVMNLA